MCVPDFKDNPNHKGNVAEAMINARALQLGLTVLHPAGEHCRYDMAFDLEGVGIKRVQCKWARVVGATIVVKLVSSRYTPNGRVTTTYSSSEIDLIAAYCEKLDSCYLIPIEGVEGKTSIQLRLEPPKNGQRAGLHYATEHEFSGAVAQLAERRYGIPKVRGSNPLSSTTQVRPSRSTVGADDFRKRFGWYMERAAAGEAFEVTRRGKPHVVLSGSGREQTANGRVGSRTPAQSRFSARLASGP